MRFQPGEGPSRGLLRDCTTSPINRFAALVQTDGLTLTGWPGSLGSTGLATTSRMQSWPAARRMEATWHGGTQLSLSF